MQQLLKEKDVRISELNRELTVYKPCPRGARFLGWCVRVEAKPQP